MKIENVVKMAQFADTYQAIAESFNTHAQDHDLYRVDVRITVEDIMAMMSEEEKQLMKCSCCSKFFHKYSSLVYIENNKIHSALFRDVDTNPEAKAAYNLLADKIEKGKITGCFGADVEGLERELGFSELGDFDHFYAILGNGDQYTLSDLKTGNSKLGSVYIGLKNLASKYKGLGNAQEYLTTINTAFQEENSITRGKRDAFQSFTNMVTIANKVYAESRDMYLAAAVIIDENMAHRDELMHFGSTVFGTLVDDYVKKGYETAVRNYLKYTDPNAYKQRDTEKVAQKELIAARDYLTENDYMRSLPQSMVTVGEVDALWTAKTVDVEETVEKTAVEKTTSLFDNIIDDRAPLEPKNEEIWPTATNIGREKFINEIVPDAESIHIFIGDGTKAGVLTRPTDVDSKPIYYWARQCDARNYVTVMPHDPVPSAFYNLKRGYVELKFIAQLPWVKEGVVNNSGLTEGWMLGTVFKPNREVRYSGLSSIAATLDKELSRYGGAIDAVVKNQRLDYDEDSEYAVYWQLSRRWTYENLRVVTKDGRRLQFNILDLD